MRTERAGQSALLFLDSVEILTREKIDYAVIGAFALSVHAVVRASSDVDALLQVSFARLSAVAKVFEGEGFQATLRRANDDDTIMNMLVLEDAHANRVKLSGGLKGLDPNVFTRSIEVPFRGVNLRIVGREDFIAMKYFAGRPQDLADAQDAFHYAQRPLDIDLLRSVARRFGRDAADRLEQLLA